jgi:alcohol dehydrogenase class IV
VRNLKNALAGLRRELAMPATLAQAGVKPSQVRQLRDEIVSAALADPCCATNPVKVDKSMVEEVLQRVTGVG